MRTRLTHLIQIGTGLLPLAGLSLAGSWLARTAHLPVPGPVLGLGLFLLMLALVPALAERMAPACDFLLQHLGLFIIPAAVGLVLHAPALAAHGVQLAVLLVVTTLLTGLVAALAGGRLR